MIVSDKKRLTLPVILLLVLTCLLPAAHAVMGVVGLFCGAIFNVSIAWLFFILPGITILLLVRNAISQKAMWKKIMNAVAGLVVAFFIMNASFFVSIIEDVDRYTGDEARNRYTAAAENKSLLPSMEEMGNPVSLEYCEYDAFMTALFQSDTDTLICAYTPEEYALQKAATEQQYEFAAEPYTYREHVCPAEIELDGYSFRLRIGEGIWYPKEVALVGTNDETHEIVHIYFYDMDLDYIDDLARFITEDCGWKYLR